MATVVAAIGTIVCAMGLLIMISPGRMKKIAEMFRNPKAMYIAVALRIVLGALMIYAGPFCRPEMPWVGWTVRIVGIVIVVAAVILLFLGPKRFVAIIDWALQRPQVEMRLWSLAAVVLGGFLLWAGL